MKILALFLIVTDLWYAFYVMHKASKGKANAEDILCCIFLFTANVIFATAL